MASFVPSLHEHYAAIRAVQRSKRSTRIFDAAFPVLMGANVALVVLRDGWRGLFSGWAVVFVVFLALWLARPHIGRWQLARHRARNPTLVGTHTFTLSREGVRLETPNASVNIEWSGIVRAQETADLFLLYFARDLAYFIPRRAVREADEAPLRALLAERLGARARPARG